MIYGNAATNSVPTVSSTAGPAYATDVNACIEEIQTCLASNVTPSSFTMNAALDFLTYGANNLAYANLYDAATTLTGTNKVYVKSSELYFLDGAGRTVQITSGGSLNAAGIGGIVGDYGGSDPAKVTFTDASNVYVFTTDPGIPASLDARTVIVRQGSGSYYGVSLIGSASLAGNINRTLLAANPASTALLLVSSTGVESTSTAPTLSGLTMTGAITGATTVATAEADIRHGARTRCYSVYQGRTGSTTASISLGEFWLDSSGASTVQFPIDPIIGETIGAVSVRAKDAAGKTCTAKLFKQTIATGAVAQIGSTATSNGAGSDNQILLIAPAYTTLVTEAYYVECGFNATPTNQRFYNVLMSTTRP